MSRDAAAPPLGGRFLLAAALTSFVAASILVDRVPGINVVVVGALMAASVLLVARSSLSRGDWILGAAGLSLLSMFAVRSSPHLLFVDFLGAAGLASLALQGGTTWRAMLRGGFAVLARLYRGLLVVVRPVLDRASEQEAWLKAPWLRGSAVGGVLVVIFGTLFASADRAFAQIANDFLVPEWDPGLLPPRFLTAICAAAFTGAYALVGVARYAEGPSPWAAPAGAGSERRRVETVEWVIPIALVDLVFAAFVAVQMTVLFGGRQHVLATAGLTYAEYARSGFFQLLVVGLLVLAVIAMTVAVVKPADPRERALMKGMLGTLCGLTLVLLISALRRLGLYEEAFGFTHDRFAAHVVILWMAGVIALLLAAGWLWRGDWLPRAVVASMAVALIGVNLVDPDRFIAEHNIDRFQRTGRLDVAYLSSLSADAAPALVALPEDVLACVATLQGPRPYEEASGWSFNLARSRALELLPSFPTAKTADCSPYNP